MKLLIGLTGLVLLAANTRSERSLEALSGLQDAHQLSAHADSLKVPRQLVWSIAWQEGRSGAKGNNILGQGILRPDTVYREYGIDGKLSRVRVVYHRMCREIGRMQLNPCVNWTRNLHDDRCSLKRITSSYDDNVYCAVMNMKRLAKLHNSWTYVPSWYNGGSAVYQKEAEAYIGHLALKQYKD
jgi:hypothetical protein